MIIPTSPRSTACVRGRLFTARAIRPIPLAKDDNKTKKEKGCFQGTSIRLGGHRWKGAIPKCCSEAGRYWGRRELRVVNLVAANNGSILPASRARTDAIRGREVAELMSEVEIAMAQPSARLDDRAELDGRACPDDRGRLSQTGRRLRQPYVRRRALRGAGHGSQDIFAREASNDSGVAARRNRRLLAFLDRNRARPRT